jgi:hypothetical protein
MNEINDIKNILIGLEARIKHIEEILAKQDENTKKSSGDK